VRLHRTRSYRRRFDREARNVNLRFSALHYVVVASLHIHDHRCTARDNAGTRNELMMKDFYTVEEIAELLRVRPRTVRNWLSRRSGDLPPSIVIGRRRLFPLSAYEVWKEQRICERRGITFRASQ
jgi:excisionase family DNA binding protein